MILVIIPLLLYTGGCPQMLIMMRGIFCKTCSHFWLPLLCYRDARDTSFVHRNKYIANIEHYELSSTLPSVVLCSYGDFLLVVNHDMMSIVLCYSPHSWCLGEEFFLLLIVGKLYGR